MSYEDSLFINSPNYNKKYEEEYEEFTTQSKVVKVIFDNSFGNSLDNDIFQTIAGFLGPKAIDKTIDLLLEEVRESNERKEAAKTQVNEALKQNKAAVKEMLKNDMEQEDTSPVKGFMSQYIPDFSQLQIMPEGIFDSFNGVLSRLSESLEHHLSYDEMGHHINTLLSIIEALRGLASIPFTGGVPPHYDGGFPGDEGGSPGGGNAIMYFDPGAEPSIFPIATLASNGTLFISGMECHI